MHRIIDGFDVLGPAGRVLAEHARHHGFEHRAPAAEQEGVDQPDPVEDAAAGGVVEDSGSQRLPPFFDVALGDDYFGVGVGGDEFGHEGCGGDVDAGLYGEGGG